MVKAIPMEDWLRGCIYHDGRHGYVTLPTDKVHQIANYIQRTRRSTTDGLIDLKVVEADRKTEPQFDKDINVRSKDEPQIDGILFKGNLKEGDYKLIKTTNGWVLEGNDIAYYGEPRTERSNE